MSGGGRRYDVRLVTCARLPDGDREVRWLADRMRAAGLAVDVAVWTDPDVDWSAARLTWIRSTWDYHRHTDAFLAWTAHVSERSELHNPAEVIAGNVRKDYLLGLAASGVPVVPTATLRDGDATRLRELADRHGWDDVVVKPVIGLDGVGVARLDAARPEPSLRLPGGWIVQPFVSSVAREGELSVVLLDETVRWAVRKHPATGDFRVQEHLGGRTVAAATPEGAAAHASRALDALVPATARRPLLHARIDLLCFEGAWVVGEVELVEPSLYVQEDPARGDAVVRALRSRLGRD